MTTEVIGQLPCPECNTTTDLKSDGRKHTLKCNHCGVLAYYQSQQAKQQIEQRLAQAQTTTPNNTQTLTLQLPETIGETATYQLTIQRVSHELALVPKEALQDGEETTAIEDHREGQQPPQTNNGFWNFLDEPMF